MWHMLWCMTMVYDNINRLLRALPIHAVVAFVTSANFQAHALACTHALCIAALLLHLLHLQALLSLDVDDMDAAAFHGWTYDTCNITLCKHDGHVNSIAPYTVCAP